MICDAGFIIAMVNIGDRNRARAIEILSTLRLPLVTTWPCLTEAMHLVGTLGQPKLRQFIRAGTFTIPAPSFDDVIRACELMELYTDAPMDFGDASLVVTAENLGIVKILTFDRHFYAYRINGRTPFEVLPG